MDVTDDQGARSRSTPVMQLVRSVQVGALSPFTRLGEYMQRRSHSPDDDDLDTGLRPLSLPPDGDAAWKKAVVLIGVLCALGLAIIALIGR